LRRQLSFRHEGDVLAGTLDEAGGRVGLLIVTGGTEIRAGAHGGLARLARDVAAAGFPVFRFDRRGVGDSGGTDPGYDGSGPDIAAAAQAFRAVWPRIEHVVGFGLCDGASALALSGIPLSGLILANPWVVETSAGTPPPAAIRRRYVERLTSLDGWKKLLGGSVDYRKLITGIGSVVRPARNGLAERIAQGLSTHGGTITAILADGDATAIACSEALDSRSFSGLRRRIEVERIDSGSHSFTGEAHDALLAAVLAALRRQEDADQA